MEKEKTKTKPSNLVAIENVSQRLDQIDKDMVSIFGENERSLNNRVKALEEITFSLTKGNGNC